MQSFALSPSSRSLLFWRSLLPLFFFLFLLSPRLVLAQEDGSDGKAVSEKTIQDTLQEAEKARTEKRYDDALQHLSRALVLLRQKPLFRKLPVYMSMGVVLHRKGQTGLAWKAFEQALYQYPCAQLSKTEAEDAEMREIVERIRQRVFRRGGLQERALPCPNVSDPSTPPPSSSGPSPWPWVVTGIAAAGLSAGLFLLFNSMSMRSEIDKWSQAAIARGYKSDEVTSLAQPTRSSSDSQMLGAVVCLATAGVALAGAITLFVVLRPSASPSASAELPLPLSSSRNAQTSVLFVSP